MVREPIDYYVWRKKKNIALKDFSLKGKKEIKTHPSSALSFSREAIQQV